MNKKSILFIACIVAVLFIKAQNVLNTDSLTGFDFKELQHHLASFKGTETQKLQYIAGVKKRFINKKYNIGVNANQRNGYTATQAYDCTNIGFESGNASGWTVTGDFAITSGTGVDAFGNYPIVYPGGGNFSLQLSSNNISTSNFQSSATRVILVTAANNFLNLHYAVDVLDYPHAAADAAKFTVAFFDATGTELTCPQLDCYSTGSGTSGTLGTEVGLPNAQITPGSPGVNLGGQTYPVTYQTWQTVTADLSAYVGQNITCEIKCDWCIYNYDWAYCYIDADCGSSGSSSPQITASNPLCTGGSTMLSGPPGMTTYNWTGPVSGTGQNLITSVPGNYTLTTTTSAGSCFSSAPVLYYTLIQTTTAAPVVSVLATHDTICAGATSVLTASGANTYLWNTNAVTNTITVSPPSDASYTVIGKDTTTGCAGSATQLIHVSAIIIQTANNPICTGTTATLTASGASTYTWSSNAGSATTNTVVVSPTVNTTYTVTGYDINTGCTISTSILVHMATNVSIGNPNDSLCQGITGSLVASGASTYTWSTGATSAGISVTPTITTIYTVSATGSCINTATTIIYVKPLPALTINTSALACEGTPTTLTASGANTYTWNTGLTTSSITVTPTVNTSYNVTGTAANMCKNTAVTTVIVPVNVAPLICMATTDSTTNYGYNNIYWDKTAYNNVDSFIVYRLDAISNNYLRIGAASKTAFSEFKDTAFSIGGPNGGNPIYSSWKYKLAIRDTCGNISALSPYHQTMFVQQSGANFSWNAYTVETGQTNPVTGYSFLRDDNNTGNWHILVNTIGTSATDPNYASYPNGNWRIDAIGFNCTPTLRLAGNNNSTQSFYMRSHSNTIKTVLTGINQSTNNIQLAVYPNPTNELLYVECKLKNTTIYITDMLGNKIKQVNVEADLTSIDTGNLSNGIYFLNVNTVNGIITKKFVVQR